VIAASVAYDLRSQRSTDDLAAAPQDRQDVTRRSAIREQSLLRFAATLDQAAKLPRIQFRPFLGEALADLVGEAEIHIVAAEQDVVADGHSLEDQLAVPFPNRDQAQVGRTAADVADQNQVAQPHRCAPVVAARVDPGVEGSLRLFEDRYLWQSRFARGAYREIARHGIERRRNGEQNFLLFDRRFLVRLVPRLPNVGQIARRHLDGRQFGDFLRASPRKDRRRAVDAAMRQPRLRGCDDSRRNLRAVLLSKRAYDDVGIVLPGQAQRLRGKLGLRGDVEERGQELASLDRPRCRQLRNAQYLHAAVFAARIDEGDHAVRRPEVDTDDEARLGLGR
jgi:hypothetical protein